MYLIQFLLPLYDNEGRQFAQASYAQVNVELTERFGGVTAYAQAPASGLWQQGEGKVMRDELIVHEVMAETLDQEWWRGYRQRLEARFSQASIVNRTLAVQML